MSLREFLLWALVGIPLLAGLYVGGVYLVAWFEVKALPKSEVFMCMKHGPIQKESTISFSGTPYCPICFSDNLHRAESMLK